MTNDSNKDVKNEDTKDNKDIKDSKDKDRGNEKLENEERENIDNKAKSKGNGGNGEDKPKFNDLIDEEAKKKEEEELINQLQEEIDKLTTKDIVIQMMMSLSSLAYKKMGIPEGVNDKFKDKAQAKLAIDCFEALFKVLSEEISAQETENLKASLSNLQLNFVKKFL